MLDELKNLPVSLMNSRGAIDDMFCSPYGFYKDIFHEALHLNFVRKNLTTDLWDVTEEITLSWNDMLANVGDGLYIVPVRLDDMRGRATS